MDFENIFYVVLAVIYFLSRLIKKKKQLPPEETQGEGQSQPEAKPVSFEDLLKEFGVGQEEEKPQEVEEEEDLEEQERIEQEYRSRYSDEEAKSIFEKSIAAAEEVEVKEEKELTFKEFKPYQEQKETNDVSTEIMELLQSDDGGKKAIILSEILNRKY